MKTKHSMKHALAGLLGILIFASACELPADTESGLLAEFTGCDFPGATMAMVEVRLGSTPVAYGYGTLTNGNASFRLKDVNTNEPWNATLNVEYNAAGYCYTGAEGDPVPANGYWRANVSKYIEYQASEYAKMSFYKSYFSSY